MSLSLSRMSIAVLAACLFTAPAFAGYEYPLQSPEIRNAFFLGQRADNTPSEFLSNYTHRITQQQTGTYSISEVDVLTPYAQIVRRGAKNIPGDSEVQTETDLHAHPLSFIVQVTLVQDLVYTGDAGLVIPQGPQPDFSIELEQAQSMAPLRVTKTSFGGGRCPCGMVIKAEFDPAKITSAPLHITVHTPDGRSVSADFDLSKLK